LGAGLGIHTGKHWIRTNGNETERWMAFVRMFRPDLNPAPRLLQAAVPWVGPGFFIGCDARTKTNVWQVEGALEKLERIRGVTFEWAEAESPDALGGVPGQPSIGVLAQEVEEVFPELVSIYEPEHEYKAVDYQGLTTVLIEAVKELKAQNEALRSRMEALEGAQK
jgi:Chaperone of endosialidase